MNSLKRIIAELRTDKRVDWLLDYILYIFIAGGFIYVALITLAMYIISR